MKRHYETLSSVLYESVLIFDTNAENIIDIKMRFNIIQDGDDVKVLVRLKSEDLLSGETSIVAEGNALLNGDRLRYMEKETGAGHDILFTEERIEIRRKSDFPTTLTFEGNRGTAEVESPYGTMVLETEIVERKKEKYEWILEYRIRGGSDIVTHQRMTWNIIIQ